VHTKEPEKNKSKCWTEKNMEEMNIVNNYKKVKSQKILHFSNSMIEVMFDWITANIYSVSRSQIAVCKLSMLNITQAA